MRSPVIVIRSSRLIRDEYEPLRQEYSRIAARYDTRWKFYVEASIQGTLQRVHVAPGDYVLDVGCGTGILLEALSSAEPQAKFTGIDLSGAMLDVARRRLGPTIDLSQAHAENLPFCEAAFDFVFSTNAFHFIHNPLAALREVRRVLKPSGTVVITDWCDDYLACRVCDLFLRLFNRAHFQTYGSKKCRKILTEAGFSRVNIDRYTLNWLWGLMTATARKEQLGKASTMAVSNSPC